jgi:hypothetical protein
VPQSQLPAQSIPGLPRGGLPSGAIPPGFSQRRGSGNPLQDAAQLFGRTSDRGSRLPNPRSTPSGAADSNDPSLLPFAENVLSQVQQLVNRLKDNNGR